MRNPITLKLSHYTHLSRQDIRFIDILSEGQHRFARRKDLIRQGGLPDGTLFILQGFACRYKLLGNGARQITDLLVPGDHCNFAESLVGGVDHSIGTLTPCTILSVAPDATATMAARHPDLFRALQWAEFVQAATLREWIANIGRRPAERRIAHLICELFHRLQLVGCIRDNTYDLPLTQEDLGDAVGTSVVHVNRVLQSLRRQGLISSRGTSITIHNLDALTSLAEFRDCYLHLNGRRIRGRVEGETQFDARSATGF